MRRRVCPEQPCCKPVSVSSGPFKLSCLPCAIPEETLTASWGGGIKEGGSLSLNYCPSFYLGATFTGWWGCSYPSIVIYIACNSSPGSSVLLSVGGNLISCAPCTGLLGFACGGTNTGLVSYVCDPFHMEFKIFPGDPSCNVFIDFFGDTIYIDV